jgi:hypothetical protein
MSDEDAGTGADGGTDADEGANEGPADGPPDPERWTQVTAELEGIAEEYRKSGWSVVTAVPDTVHTRGPDVDPEGNGGFDLVIPDDDYEPLAAHVAGREFDSYEVFRGDGAGAVYLVVAVEAPVSERAVLYPAYFDDSTVGPLHDAAEAGPLHTHLRAVDGDERVTFTHDTPAPFFPSWNETAEQ